MPGSKAGILLLLLLLGSTHSTAAAPLPTPANQNSLKHTLHGYSPRLQPQDHMQENMQESLGLRRRLQQEAPAEVTVVTSALELMNAFVSGSPHIQLREHVDLTGLSISPSFRLGPVPVTVKSIRGNCTGAPPTVAHLGLPTTQAPMRDFKVSQCLILTRHDFPSGTSSLWLDKLYIRSANSFTERFGELLEVLGADARLWMTEVTLQGNGDSAEQCEDCGLDVWENASVRAEDCIFSDFSGVRVLRAFAGASVALVRCSFIDNQLFFSKFGTGVIQADGDDRFGNSSVWLQGCMFSGNTPDALPVLLADNREDVNTHGVFYSDTPDPQVCVYEGPDDSGFPPPCQMVRPMGLGGVEDLFLSSSSAWLQQVKQELATLPEVFYGASRGTAKTPGSSVTGARVPVTGSASPPTIPEEQGVGAAVIAVVAVVAAFLLMVIAGLVVLLRKQQRLGRAASRPGGVSGNAKMATSAHTQPRRMPHPMYRPGAKQMHGPHAHAPEMLERDSGNSETFSIGLAMPPSQNNAGTDTRQDGQADSDVLRPVSHGRTVTFTVKNASHVQSAKRHTSLGRAWNLRHSEAAQKGNPEAAGDPSRHPDHFGGLPMHSMSHATGGNDAVSGFADTSHQDIDTPCSHAATAGAEDDFASDAHHEMSSGLCDPAHSTRTHSAAGPPVQAHHRNYSTSSHVSDGNGAMSALHAPRSHNYSSTDKEHTSSNPCAETSSSHIQTPNSSNQPRKVISKRDMSTLSLSRTSGTEVSLKHFAVGPARHAWACSGNNPICPGARTRMHAPRHMLVSAPSDPTTIADESTRKANSEPGVPEFTASGNTSREELPDAATPVATDDTSGYSLNMLYGTAILSSDGVVRNGGSSVMPPAASKAEGREHSGGYSSVRRCPQDARPCRDSTCSDAAAAAPDEMRRTDPELQHAAQSRSAMEVAHGQPAGASAAEEADSGAPAAQFFRLSDPGACGRDQLSDIAGMGVNVEATFAAMVGTLDTKAGTSSTEDVTRPLPAAAATPPPAAEDAAAAASAVAAAAVAEGGPGAGTAGAAAGGLPASGAVVVLAGTGSMSTLDLVAVSESVRAQPHGPSTQGSHRSYDTEQRTVCTSYDAESEQAPHVYVPSPAFDRPFLDIEKPKGSTQEPLPPSDPTVATEHESERAAEDEHEKEGSKSGDVFTTSDEETLSQWTFELPTMQPLHTDQSLMKVELEDVHEPRTEPPKKPRRNASTAAWLEYIQQQLEGYGPVPLLLNQFELLGPKHRCCGGQGVVQFARGSDDTGTHLYAIKFYARVRHFQEESEIYRTSPLRRFMPAVVRMERNADGSIKDPFGKPLAPFVVMQKAQTLHDRLQKGKVEMYMVAQVLGHISQRIAELHEAGFVHRDLKPGNIMWQPRTYTWVLIDFGLAARIGRTARVGCTPPYAAPETASALLRRQRTENAKGSVDAWALGVLAFELLLERPAFGPFVSVDQIFERLVDPGQPLPWEEGCITMEDKKNLGKFRKPLLKLLKRKAADRATVKEFCKQMADIYSSSPKANTFRGATPMRW